MKRSFPLIVALLCSCATPEEIAAQNALDQQAYINRLAARCTQFGFRDGSSEHSNCMLQLHQQREADANALLRGLAIEQQRINAEQRNRPLIPPPALAPAPTYTNCTRDYFGNLNCVTR